jgi:hypothetical protein
MVVDGYPLSEKKHQDLNFLKTTEVVPQKLSLRKGENADLHLFTRETDETSLRIKPLC